MNVIENKSFDGECALYGSHELLIKNCSFDGPADGESASKKAVILKWRTVFLICGIHFGMTRSLRSQIQK